MTRTPGFEDSHARALWAAGTALGCFSWEEIRLALTLEIGSN
jgi:hypothetical protein